MDAGKVSGIVVIMLLPTLIAATLLYLPRAIRAFRRWRDARAGSSAPRPVHPPIEQLAADLRRLLGEHDVVRRSTGQAMRAHHLVALEAAITDCATKAAGALGVECPERGAGRTLARPDLRRLLHALGDAGLMLPATSTLLGVEGHI